MDKGKAYDIYYKDDTQTRHKNLIFESTEDGLLHFYNKRNNCIEIIPLTNIIRIQGEKENGRENP